MFTYTSPVTFHQMRTVTFRWALFLRLFIVMGATWTMEAASWIFSDDGSFFYITDIMNATQGVAIFVLFVMRRKVKELIIKR